HAAQELVVVAADEAVRQQDRDGLVVFVHYPPDAVDQHDRVAVLQHLAIGQDLDGVVVGAVPARGLNEQRRAPFLPTRGWIDRAGGAQAERQREAGEQCGPRRPTGSQALRRSAWTERHATHLPRPEVEGTPGRRTLSRALPGRGARRVARRDAGRAAGGRRRLRSGGGGAVLGGKARRAATGSGVHERCAATREALRRARAWGRCTATLAAASSDRTGWAQR